MCFAYGKNFTSIVRTIHRQIKTNLFQPENSSYVQEFTNETKAIMIDFMPL